MPNISSLIKREYIFIIIDSKVSSIYRLLIIGVTTYISPKLSYKYISLDILE